MTRKRRAAGDAILIAAGIVFALVIGEIFLRITPFGQADFYIYDSHLGWTLKAGAHGWQTSEGRALLRVNRWGYRGRDWPLQKPSRTFRIAVLGDSFTEAQQVPEDKTFCAVIGRQLGPCPAFHTPGSQYDRAEVLNLGVDSYGTAQELITLQRRVWKFAPDMVVLAIFTGNDIRNNSVVLEGDKCRPFYEVRDGAMVPGGPFDDSLWFRTGCKLRFESRHIQVLNAAGRARSVVRASMLSRRARPVGTPANPALVEPGINDLIYRPPASPVWQEAWDVTEREISAVNQECVRHRVRFLALTLANPAQDNPDPNIRASYEKWLGVNDLDYPDRRIQQLGKREGFDVLSVAAPMREYAETHHVALHGFSNTAPGMGHWNELGHQVAGEIIASHICATLGGRTSSSVR